MRAICRRYGVVPSLILLLVFIAPFNAAPASAASSDPYTDPAKWVCRPDRTDVCDSGQDATVVRADGSTSVERWSPATNPPIDCFYLYPTVSYDLSANSDWRPATSQELYAAKI